MLTVIETPIFQRMVVEVLVAIYTKAKFDNMPAAVLKMWKDACDA